MSRYIQQGVFVDGQGAIVPSGTISVYLTGTTNAASIYTASSGGTAVNSVTSGSDGSWSFYVDTDDYAMTQNFDITLSKTDFTPKTYSNIKIFPAADSQIILQDVSGKTVRDLFDGGHDVPLKVSDVITKSPWVDVRAFGATGDGTTDDTTAIQSALDSISNGTVFFPDGTYKITTKLTLHSGLRVFGESVGGTLITAVGVDALYSPESAENVVIENLYLDGDSTASTYGIHIYKNPRKTVIRNIKIRQFGTSGNGGAIFLDGDGASATWGVLVENVNGEGCGRGIVSSSAQALDLISNTMRQNAGPSSFSNGGAITIVGGIYEKVSSTYSATDGNGYGIVFDTITRSQIINVYFETSRDGLLKIKDSSNVSVSNCHTRGVADADVDFGQIYINNSLHCKVSCCNINGLSSAVGTGKANIYIDATSKYNIIEGNILEDDGNFGAGNYNVVDLGEFNNYNNNNFVDSSGDYVGISLYDGSNSRWIAGQYTKINSIQSFVADDATPDVSSQLSGNPNGYMVLGRSHYKTANVNPTTITAFDNGTLGQEIWVLINDDITTVDFSGTTLKGNGGIDWKPLTGDSLTGVFDGTNWNIEVKENALRSKPIPTLADDATPSVAGLRTALTGGTTTITDLDDGVEGQTLTIISEHAITITDGTNIFLNGSANFVMAATDTLTLIQKADGLWYEISRSDNT